MIDRIGKHGRRSKLFTIGGKSRDLHEKIPWMIKNSKSRQLNLKKQAKKAPFGGLSLIKKNIELIIEP